VKIIHIIDNIIDNRSTKTLTSSSFFSYSTSSSSFIFLNRLILVLILLPSFGTHLLLLHPSLIHPRLLLLDLVLILPIHIPLVLILVLILCYFFLVLIRVREYALPRRNLVLSSFLDTVFSGKELSDTRIGNCG